MFKKLVVYFTVIFLGSCQSPPIAPKPTPTQSPNVIKPSQLTTATAIEIKNDWNGYSDITPIVRHYKLKPQNTVWRGNGYFAVGGYGAYDIRQQYTKKISIPIKIANQFLQKLSDTKIHSSSQYKPIITHADDYPAITIQITTPQQNIVFFSSSQGANHVPWQVKIKEKGSKEYYVSQSAAPEQALLLLKPYIDHPGLEQVIHKRRLEKAQTANLKKSP